MITALLAALLALPASAGTVVTLGFDDGTSSQLPALPVLNSRGVKATFYLNTARIGTGGTFYFSRATIDAIAAAGHEIAGHTLNHSDLNAATEAERRRQICDDRANLVAWGFNPASLAYPYGYANAAVQQAARDCGYDNARALGGLSCAGCPGGESLPPANRFFVRTPPFVGPGTTLAQLQQYVLNAESQGGGWVPLVIHEMCSGGSCPNTSMSTTTLAAFVDWVLAREPMGTVIRTNAQALGAGGPPPPPPPPPAPSTETFSLWPAQTPAAGEFYLDPNPISLGVRFFSDEAGAIAGIRFYKVPGNNGAHVGRLYTAAGALLGSASFASETASGWQFAPFASPIPISSGTVYVASYHSPTGYSATRGALNAPRDNPPLHAPANGAGAAQNGRYAYGASPAFPANGYLATNYWVDVVFTRSSSTAAPGFQCANSLVISALGRLKSSA